MHKEQGPPGNCTCVARNALKTSIWFMHFLHSSIENPGIVQSQQLPHLEGNETNNSQVRHLKMAYATDNQTLRQSALGGRIAALMIELRAAMARRKAYNTTYRELAVLSDRELADLGIHRSEIRGIAWQAAYEM